MNLRSLRFFLAVAENNGVQKAAESLHLTQPNISRALKALEEELNAQLFVRTARGVEITEEGGRNLVFGGQDQGRICRFKG